MSLYYYLDSYNQQHGPVEANELIRRGVTRDSMVWKQGMSDWETAGSRPDLSRFFMQPTEPQRYYPYQPTQPRPQQPTYQQQEKPNNLLVWSIISTVICWFFPPTGIVAIVQSCKVNSCWDAGDYEGAVRAANNAKAWNFVSLGLCIGWNIIYLIVSILVENWNWWYWW